MRESSDGQKRHHSGIHSSSTKTTYGSSDDEGIHVRSGATDGGPNLEESDTEHVYIFGVKLAITLTPRGSLVALSWRVDGA